MATYDWIIGLGISFLIAIVFTVFSSIKKEGFEINGKAFFIFLTIGFAISVYSGLLDIWYFILSLIFTVVIIFYEIVYNKRGV